jgi:hypothetical protein
MQTFATRIISPYRLNPKSGFSGYGMTTSDSFDYPFVNGATCFAVYMSFVRGISDRV